MAENTRAERKLAAILAADERIEFRIDVNLGDVIAEGDDLYGDGVNIAARLETLAEPGAVFISNAAHEHVRDRLPFAFEDLGERWVKNIARPLRVFRVTLTHPGAKAPGSILSRTAGEGAERRRREAGEGSPPALALPDKPSIAVLPFQNLSGDPEQEYFARRATLPGMRIDRNGAAPRLALQGA